MSLTTHRPFPEFQSLLSDASCSVTNTGTATVVTSPDSTDVTFEVLYGKQKHTCQLSKLVTVEIPLQTPPFMPHLAPGTSRALAVRFEENWVA